MCTPMVGRMLDLLDSFGKCVRVSPECWFSVPGAVGSVFFSFLY